MASFVSFDSCEGNPGALAFMMEAYNPKKSMGGLFKVERAFARVMNYHHRQHRKWFLQYQSDIVRHVHSSAATPSGKTLRHT